MCLLVTLSLQEDPEKKQHRVKRRGTASTEYKDLLGTFDDDLKNDLGNLAIGTKSFQVRKSLFPIPVFSAKCFCLH